VHVHRDEGPTLILDKNEASAESHVGNAASYIRSILSLGNPPTRNRFYFSVISSFRGLFLSPIHDLFNKLPKAQIVQP